MAVSEKGIRISFQLKIFFRDIFARFVQWGGGEVHTPLWRRAAARRLVEMNVGRSLCFFLGNGHASNLFARGIIIHSLDLFDELPPIGRNERDEMRRDGMGWDERLYWLQKTLIEGGIGIYISFPSYVLTL